MTDAITSFKLFDKVQTPNGEGLIQGRLTKPGEPDRLIISHKKADIPEEIWITKTRGGPFILWHYALNDVAPIDDGRS